MVLIAGARAAWYAFGVRNVTNPAPPVPKAAATANPQPTAALLPATAASTPGHTVQNPETRRGPTRQRKADASGRELKAGADDDSIAVLKQPAPDPTPSETASRAGPVLEHAQDLIRAGQYNQALPLLQSSAASGSPEGQRFMGDAFELGWGVPKDYVRAREWYEKSAAGGNTLAMIRIGSIFEQGWGVPQDYLRAHQ